MRTVLTSHLAGNPASACPKSRAWVANGESDPSHAEGGVPEVGSHQPCRAWQVIACALAAGIEVGFWSRLRGTVGQLGKTAAAGADPGHPANSTGASNTWKMVPARRSASSLPICTAFKQSPTAAQLLPEQWPVLLAMDGAGCTQTAQDCTQFKVAILDCVGVPMIYRPQNLWKQLDSCRARTSAVASQLRQCGRSQEYNPGASRGAPDGALRSHIHGQQRERSCSEERLQNQT